jgi:hypothetical protein
VTDRTSETLSLADSSGMMRWPEVLLAPLHTDPLAGSRLIRSTGALMVLFSIDKASDASTTTTPIYGWCFCAPFTPHLSLRICLSGFSSFLCNACGMEQGEVRGIEDELQERPRFGSELVTIKQNITVRLVV